MSGRLARQHFVCIHTIWEVHLALIFGQWNGKYCRGDRAYYLSHVNYVFIASEFLRGQMPKNAISGQIPGTWVTRASSGRVESRVWDWDWVSDTDCRGPSAQCSSVVSNLLLHVECRHYFRLGVKCARCGAAVERTLGWRPVEVFLMGNIMERLNILQNHDRINNSPAERSLQHCSNTSSELESLTQFLLLGKARLNLNRRMVRTKPFLTGPYCLSIVILRHLLPHNQSQSIRQKE